MAKDPGPPTEPDLPRLPSRSVTAPLTLERLDQVEGFRPVLVAVAAMAAGLILAPGWIIRSYPTDDSLLGQPSSTDIKAAYDDRGDIIDEKATARARAEAVARVRRIHDLDAERGARTAEVVRAAFAAARTAASTPREEAAPGETPRAALERALELTLAEPMASALEQTDYSTEVAEVVAVLVQGALAEPVVADPGVLTDDLEHGIVVRSLHDGSERVIEDVRSVPHVAAVRQAIEARAARVFGAQTEGPLPPAVQTALIDLARALVQPTLTLNRRDTDTARNEARLLVLPVTLTVKRGQMIIRDGEVFTERHLLVLRQMAKYSRGRSVVMVSLGAAVVVLVLLLAGLRFNSHRRIRLSSRDALFLTALFVVGLVGARLWAGLALALQDASTWWSTTGLLFLMPVAAAPMIVRLVLRAEVALLFGVVLSVLLGLLVAAEHLFTVYALVGTLTGVTAIRSISRRGDVLRAGVWVGGVQALSVLGIQLFSAQSDLSVFPATILAAFLSGILAGFVALATTPVAEMVFRYTTDLRLLELANLNHPALKELIVQAPGTYHHSIIVGSLVEAAAEAIGANALLAKVMAYYHDLGKGCNAMYFIENQRGGHNPHDKLKPSMSAMVIRRHVTDGLDVAERYALGPEILAGIAEHHGTTLIQYFYARAVEEAGDDHAVNESDYRYPGQKPQSRETAIVMLGDSVEAAARSLSDPTPARLQGLVNRIINVKFTDGQLEECDLTLRDLHTIARAFMKVLTSIYHQRVEYPDTTRSGRHDDTDPKSKGPSGGSYDAPPEDRPDNLRRLGLSGR